MLTAKLQNGQTVNLLDSWQKEVLQSLQKKQGFYCPACKEKLVLKIGSQRQWHFAHQSKEACRVSTEPESHYHLSGKRLLYQWLKRQKLEVALEVYLPILQQRPDILLRKDKQLVAVEYQCSSLPLQEIKKRTDGYKRAGIYPIWVLGGNRLNREGTFHFRLQSFEWLALCKDPYEHLHLRYFCPTSLKFFTLSNITPISLTKTLAVLKEKAHLNQTFQDWVYPSLKPHESLPSDAWLTQKKQWRFQYPIPYPSPDQRHFQSWLYEQNLHPQLFPIEAGWPSKGHEWVATPTYLWQSWILCHVIERQPLMAPFPLLTVLRSFQSQRIFKLRPIVQHLSHLEQSIKGYLDLLVSARILAKAPGHNQYVRLRERSFPHSAEEALTQDEAFYHAYLTLDENRLSCNTYS
ncbi:competence protein CoiA [Halalkalibacterium halodurans]|uniref:competence protein CoiA n=1 Tax=Halalkalibacterium halodurans TaxID=86665 RepID=UPI002AA98237|nr:competence protein CoiA [Halalkalibacterium halodurans]MDY7223409.1 competence protein CoiA [Halalkalibacterium halodurans]MDY7242630.1 competence protein CoiA [Halalkalibacterium halodurans]